MSEQDKQLMYCAPFMDVPEYRDIQADRVVTAEELQSGIDLLPEDENSLIVLCWRAREYGFGRIS